MKNTIKIGITTGDATGVGPELIEKVTADRKFMELYPLDIFSVEGDPAGVRSLYTGVEALKTKEIDALVTCPIDKGRAAEEGFPHIGHTEFFAEQFGVAGRETLMFMVSDTLRVVLVTKHVPLAEVPKMLTVQKILDVIRSTRRSLQVDFGIDEPKIAVLGFNPHAGENGLLGDEERRVIAPAIEAAVAEGAFVFGPFAADGFFGSGAWSKYDAVVAMYHDQGLIPFKTLSMDSGVNFTAGLPVVRTSPAHGTASDIAGQGIASDASLRAAIYTAVDIVRSRQRFAELRANVLTKQASDEDQNRGRRPARDENVEDLFADGAEQQ